MTRLANFWASEGHDICLVTVDDDRSDFFELDPKVERRVLRCAGASKSLIQALARNWRTLRYLRGVIRDMAPDAVLSFMDSTNVLTSLAAIGLRRRVVVSERNNPDLNPLPLVWKLARRFAYHLADCIVVQTEAVRDWYVDRGLSNVVVIPNPVIAGYIPSAERDAYRASLARNKDELIVVSVGRLVDQKGFDVLLEAFAALRTLLAGVAVRLCIAGEGPLREQLGAQIAARDLSGNVTLLGNVHAVEKLLAAADLFVSSSRFEGFPNVLAEAMAIGCSVVSFEYNYGPRELITHGVDGLLVPPGDYEALAQAMCALIRDCGLREGLGRAAQEKINR